MTVWYCPFACAIHSAIHLIAHRSGQYCVNSNLARVCFWSIGPGKRGGGDSADKVKIRQSCGWFVLQYRSRVNVSMITIERVSQVKEAVIWKLSESD
jgi:hypothetical protein